MRFRSAASRAAVPRRPPARRRLAAGYGAFLATFALVVAACGAHRDRTLHLSGRTTVTATVAVTSSTRATTTTLPYATYRVTKGDTLSRIAARYRVDPAAIVALNHIQNPDVLAEGLALRIPPAPPLKLAITPAAAPAGTAFHLTLTGAHPGEQITFEVRSPKSTFSGPPHTATPGGTVQATYQSSAVDPAGAYSVAARGNAGTVTLATFAVRASTPAT